jgi:hypothetical protein
MEHWNASHLLSDADAAVPLISRLWEVVDVSHSAHSLTLDHMKKEARDLLHGLQRGDPYALRRCHVVDPSDPMFNPALDHARFIIAREHGFSSWRKLKEHVDATQL